MPSQWLKQWFPHLPSALDRAPTASLMCAGALLMGVALAGARSSVSTENGKAPSETAVAPADAERERIARFREGDELVDRVGQFSTSGDRVVFAAAEGKVRFIALENLPLERVAKAIVGNPASLQWTVSGKVSEYRGTLYLLLTRAQRQTQLQATESKP
ncbi:MAG: hypothetical protein IT426_10440 [Pirellulales bacterium]|nr:hypothetical protein [Pirellulales bacterium]